MFMVGARVGKSWLSEIYRDALEWHAIREFQRKWNKQEIESMAVNPLTTVS